MNEQSLTDLTRTIPALDPKISEAAQARLDDLTKPPGSLGRLEEVARRLATIQGTSRPVIRGKRIYTMAGDHGVTEEGVSAFPREVTPQMVFNFLNGGAAINVLARHVGAQVVVVDVGVDHDFEGAAGLVHAKVGRGTRNLARGPAMSRDDALRALAVGVELGRKAVEEGVNLVGIGEMGIGNTTPASALLAAFSGLPAEEVVGRGTGVGDEGIRRKVEAVRLGIEKNRPDRADPLGVLAALGGYEIAGMAGVCIGGASAGIPVVVDGFISTSAALVAVKLAPKVADYLFVSHLSQEKAHKLMLQELGQKPLLDLDMRLGEGTGAALAMGIIEASAKILSEMATFADAGVSMGEA